MRFHNASFRVSCHATEEPEKVLAALRFVVGEDADVEEEHLEGAHANPVIVYTSTTNRTAEVRDLLRRLADDDPAAIPTLMRQLDARFDENLNLFFRLDKQDAYQGQLRLTTTEDVIHVKAKVAAWPARREAGLGHLQEFFAELAAGKTK